ncbi:MAG: hypothetical protein ACREQK_00490 [Candidatus Binatia bacterium]
MKPQGASSINRALLDLGARLGSLEGYFYAEERVEKKYLSGWIDNIERQFAELPSDVRVEVAGDYQEIWRKVGASLARLYSEQDPMTVRVREILSGLKKQGDL